MVLCDCYKPNGEAIDNNTRKACAEIMSKVRLGPTFLQERVRCDLCTSFGPVWLSSDVKLTLSGLRFKHPDDLVEVAPHVDRALYRTTIIRQQ